MDRRLVIDCLVIILLLGAVIGLIQNYKQIKEQEYLCLESPFVYGAQRFTEANGDQEVSGVIYVQGYNEPAFRFNTKELISLSLTSSNEFGLVVPIQPVQ